MASKADLGFDSLRQRLGYGARQNKYLVNLTTPSGISLDGKQILAFCKGAAIPSREMGICEIYIQGRKIPIPGDAEFAGTWDLTFYNDQTHALRKQFEIWIEKLDSYFEHRRDFAGNAYWADKFQISQLDAKDQTKEVATWEFFHVFPSSISQVDFGADSNNQVSEFSITFTYAHYRRVK